MTVIKQRTMRLGLALLACTVLGVSVGCGGVMGPTTGMWMDVKGPIQGGSGGGSKTGEACSQSWAGVVALGDASIETAAKNGGITRINSVDYHATNRIVMGKFCTIVRGS
jgi:hypothetical protein